MNSTWEMITAIAAALQALVVLLALIYAAMQLRSATNDRHISLLYTLHQLLNDRKAILNRRVIFTEFPSKPGTLTQEQFLTAREVWDLMNYVGTIAHFNLASGRMIREVYSLMIARLWTKLEPHISYYRKERVELVPYFEELAKVCLEYRRKKYGELTPPFYHRIVFPEPDIQENT